MNNFLNTLKEPFVIFPIGPPLVGKSTAIIQWLSEYKSKVNIISRDAILLNECKTNNCALAWTIADHKEIDKILIENIQKSAISNENVILDMTNLSSKSRKYRLSFFKDTYNKVAVVFKTPSYEELLERNKKRHIEENKFISEKVIFNMMEGFGAIEEKEKFDKIVYL